MNTPLRLKDPDAVARTIEMFIFARVPRTQGALVALSGGIDSALVLGLAVRAVGPERVLGLLMPDGTVTSKQDMEDARLWAEKLGVKTHLISLEPVLREMKGALHPWDSGTHPPAWGNVKARLRMTLNYAVANHENRIVLGTGNRTELLLGYFTKYGDGGVDLLPIGMLYKTQVRQLARHLQLPLAFIDKAPSAGLWPGQTDEGELGASYDAIDQALYELVELKHRPAEIAQSLKVDERWVHGLIHRMEASAHKRQMPPVADWVEN